MTTIAWDGTTLAADTDTALEFGLSNGLLIQTTFGAARVGTFDGVPCGNVELRTWRPGYGWITMAVIQSNGAIARM